MAACVSGALELVCIASSKMRLTDLLGCNCKACNIAAMHVKLDGNTAAVSQGYCCKTADMSAISLSLVQRLSYCRRRLTGSAWDRGPVMMLESSALY